MGKNVQTCHFGYLHFIITPIFQSTVNISCHNIHVTLNKLHCKNMLLSLQHVVHPILKSAYPTLFNNMSIHWGPHLHTRSRRQIGVTGRLSVARHRFTKLLGQKKWCKRFRYKCTVYTRIKKKTNKKWCLTLENQHLGNPKLRVGRWFSFFYLGDFLGSKCSFFGVYGCVESQGLEMMIAS